MPNLLTSLEIDLRWLGALAGLGTLGYAIYRMLLAQRRPKGHHTGAAREVLRTRYLAVATLLFLAMGFLLWRPIPIQLPLGVQLLVSVVGAGSYFASLGLYLWGMRTLGENFNASSGFGVRLHQAHQLVTHGPYAFIRHPMYMGVILAFWGGLMLYRTWTMLICAIIMLGLIVRGRKEEEALAQVFGETWHNYSRLVPPWFPHIKVFRRETNLKRQPKGRMHGK
jgi:protein-S-isoprenylcysteine O-methyltransferase Ste14